MDDLRVYLALNLLERRRSIRHLPHDLQVDIAAFWGSDAAAKTDATALLFSIGKTAVIREACDRAATAGLGRLEEAHDLQLATSLVAALPPVLRVYVGAASRLYGDVESADLLKIHIQSGKLTLLMYDDFVRKALPRLIERVKVNMRSQEVLFFEYGDDLPTQLLYNKSRYVQPTFWRYREQQRFDHDLSALGLDLTGYGPDAESLSRELSTRHGVRIGDFALIPDTPGTSDSTP
jgi:DNA phosphorothioation-associated putative methyltransferase